MQQKRMSGFRLQPFQNKKRPFGKGYFFCERLINKIKTSKPRKIWFLLCEGKRLLESFWLPKRSPNKYLCCCTNSVCYSARYVFCMPCIHCMLFLYLHFKFKELKYKGIINHSYKCMIIIIPQLEKNMFHVKVV